MDSFKLGTVLDLLDLTDSKTTDSFGTPEGTIVEPQARVA